MIAWKKKTLKAVSFILSLSIGLMWMTSAANAQQAGSGISAERIVVWDGDRVGLGAKSWASPKPQQSKVSVASGKGFNNTQGLEWHAEGKGWKGFGWNWTGFWPNDGGTDISSYKNLSFMIRVEFKDKNSAPNWAGLQVSLICSKDNKPTKVVNLAMYTEDLSDQQWHEVIVPISDMLKDAGKNFDLKTAWEIDVGEWTDSEKNYNIYFDEIGFDTREISTLVSSPEKRAALALGNDFLPITAILDLSSDGTEVNPFVYGVSFGEPEVMKEMGVTMRRNGGNTVSTYNWKKGCISTGNDWFCENHAQADGSDMWINFHMENKKLGIESYMTMPMEWVAKDSVSNGFPKNLYPDCTVYATDRPDAGNGTVWVKDDNGNIVKDDKGKPKSRFLRCGERYPTQNGVYVGLEYNVELVKYCIEKIGAAKSGGIKYICTDNEPMLYNSTHKDIWSESFSYDSYWERTKKYAELIRQADPDVKIAGPAVWGWTAYFYSNTDLDNREKQNLPWDSTKSWPDYGKYGPFIKDFMRRCAEYKKATGRNLIDIFDFHGYSLNSKIESGSMNDPETMEIRCLDVRKFWDETYRDPYTWIGSETGGNIAYVPLMRKWMKETGFDAEIAVGEYQHTGWDGGVDISGAVAQSETFAAFALSQVAYGLYWANIKKNSPCYFAWKMFRNPDGKHTAVGDKFIKAYVSDFSHVSVYAYKNVKTKTASLILLNKKSTKGAKVEIAFKNEIPVQDASAWEFSRANLKAIGEIPPMKISGKKISVELPSMSILRIDIKM
ncbi:MAG: hypothetical protein A2X45_19235 [Lentisphaerae bacterium GWF2_50_93]|nr:MAG: hypothetical protein A2X45_19235 [Lentisphaerae bacterium GWF2_50_93]